MPPKQQATLKANHLSGGLHAAAVTPSSTIIRLETSSGTSGTVAARPPCTVSDTRYIRSTGTVTSQLKYRSHGSLVPLVSSPAQKH